MYNQLQTKNNRMKTFKSRLKFDTHLTFALSNSTIGFE